jgi:hydrogenase expression/formation protein
VPLITGSTLRIGGDVVIGTRMSGCVGAVGMAYNLTSRIQAREEDMILMTEGAGGATISTTALYYGMHEIVNETLNIKFFEACESLIKSDLIKKIHAMTDITNGGVRGDSKEISKVAGVKLIFEEDKIRQLVNKKVFEMLDKLEIDYLGVSLDALLIITPPAHTNEILECVRNKGVAIDIVGKVVKGNGAELILNGLAHDLAPRFRESAYTPIKKVIGENMPGNFNDMKQRIDLAAKEAIEKRERVIKQVKNKFN